MRVKGHKKHGATQDLFHSQLQVLFYEKETALDEEKKQQHWSHFNETMGSKVLTTYCLNQMMRVKCNKN